jgi:hypothetical protein
MEYIFNPDGFDWLNIEVKKDNKYTYHHIVERKNGGDDSIENGAILTEIAHRFLNVLEQFCPEAYDDLQNIFIKINNSQMPPTKEIVREIDEIMYEIFYGTRYNFSEFDLPMNSWRLYIEARGAYLSSRKKLKKCLL